MGNRLPWRCRQFQEWFWGERHKGCGSDLDHRSGGPCNSDFLLVARSHSRAGYGRCDVYRRQLPRRGAGGEAGKAEPQLGGEEMNVTHRTDPTKLGRLRILVRPRRAADRNPLLKARPWEGMRVVDGGQPCQPTSPFDF